MDKEVIEAAKRVQALWNEREEMRGLERSNFSTEVAKAGVELARAILATPPADTTPDAARLAGVNGALKAIKEMGTVQYETVAPVIQDLATALRERGQQLAEVTRERDAACESRAIVRKERIPVDIEIENDLCAFGCYGPVCETQPVPRVWINLKACAGLSVYSQQEFNKVVSETLAHELVHAIQDKFGMLFHESSINEAMGDPGEVVCETTEQVVQQLVRDMGEMQAERDAALARAEQVTRERDELKRDTATAHEYLDGAAVPRAETDESTLRVGEELSLAGRVWDVIKQRDAALAQVEQVERERDAANAGAQEYLEVKAELARVRRDAAADEDLLEQTLAQINVALNLDPNSTIDATIERAAEMKNLVKVAYEEGITQEANNRGLEAGQKPITWTDSEACRVGFPQEYSNARCAALAIGGEVAQ